MAPSARLLVAAALLLCHQVSGQDKEVGPNYIGEEDKPPMPETALLNGKVVELDELGDIIYLNRSSANLNCAEGKMKIDVNFKEPFNGIIYANFDRTSPCTWKGDGKTSYHVELPLRGCGTKQGPARVFTNNIIMRFHPHLEWAGDEVVTIVCRYPPPIAAPPVAGLPFVAGPEPAPLAPLKKIGEADIILIICAILFLALLLLGLGFGYACLKKRRISLIKSVPLESAPPSEYSTGSVMPIFDGLKIPRAHAVPLVDDVTSSETLPSDYPSESPSTAHSEMDEVEIIPSPTAGPTQLMVPPAAGVPNHAYLMTEELLNTTYTDKMVREEVDIHRQPHLMMKRPDAGAMHAAEQQLTTMLSSAERHGSATPEPPARADVRHVTAELHAPPAISSEFVVHQPPLPPPPPSEPDTIASQDLIDHVDMETVERALPPPPPPHRPTLTAQTVDDRILSTITETKVYEDIERRRRAVKEYYERKQQALPPDWDVEIRQYPPAERDFPDTASSHWDDSSVGTEVPPLPGLHAARTAFETDEHFTTTEQTFLSASSTRAGVDVTRSATAVAVPPPPPAPQPPTLPRSVPPRHVSPPPRHASPPARSGPPSLEPDGAEEPIRPLRREITPPRRHAPSMDVLIRVLEAPQEFDDRLSVLTDDDRETLRQLITREETFRTLLTEARVYEDFERIRQDARFARALSSQKWDVVIRVLAPPPLEVTPSEFSETTRAPSEFTDFSDIPEPPPEPRIHRYRKTSSQLQQLPPVYEYDDGRPGRPPRSGPGSTRSHVTTRSSYGGDVRSMTEEMVSFHRYQPDDWSEADTAPRPLPDDPALPAVHGTRQFSENWNSYQESGDLTSGTQRTYFETHQQVELPGGGQRRYIESHQEVAGRGAPSTIGDREEVYSMAETDVDWQRR